MNEERKIPLLLGLPLVLLGSYFITTGFLNGINELTVIGTIFLFVGIIVSMFRYDNGDKERWISDQEPQKIMLIKNEEQRRKLIFRMTNQCLCRVCMWHKGIIPFDKYSNSPALTDSDVCEKTGKHWIRG